MAVDGVSGVGSSSTSSSPDSTAAAQQSATLNYNNFLQLLVAQMQNQDPTDPVDASQQMSQLASFSEVEQTIQTNSKLDTLLSSSSLTQAGSYIGKYMESADGSVKGVISSVKVYSDGIIATTNDGGKILVQTGVTISDSAPASGGDSSSGGTGGTGTTNDSQSG